MIKQLPLSIPIMEKGEVRLQFAALCYRIRKQKLQVLIITSRGQNRWIVPKGWPMEGKTPAQSAEQEAWEEAGVLGKSDGRCLGVYSYIKEMGTGPALPCIAMVYAVETTRLADQYPEEGQRDRQWVSRKKAARLVDEPELARIIRDFDPRVLS